MKARNHNKLNPSADDLAVNSDVPEGWAYLKIREILKICYGKGLRESDRTSGDIPVYGSNGVVGQHSFAFTQGPTIIIGRKGTVGAVQFSEGPCWPIDTTFFIDNFRGLHPKYIVSALLSLNLCLLDTSTAIPGLNRDDLYDQYIPIAPLPEQTRIAARIEELLARVKATKERLAKVALILKRFRQAVLAAACSGQFTAGWRDNYLHFQEPVKLLERTYRHRITKYEELCRAAKQERKRCPRKPTNLKPRIHQSEIQVELPTSWFWTSLEDIASVRQYAMSSGPFGSALGSKDYRTTGIPVIRGQNIQNGSFLLKSFVYVSEEKALNLVRSSAHPGDIVVVAVGSSGQAAIVPKDLDWAILSQNCNKITLDKALALPEFVLLFLQVEIAKSQLKEKTTDTARPFLSLTNLKKTLVALPQVEEQKEIVLRVEALFKLADSIQKRVTVATSRAEKLTQAILAKAFRGELVPTEAELARRQGRSYEPASALLARIKVEHTEKGTNLRPLPPRPKKDLTKSIN